MIEKANFYLGGIILPACICLVGLFFLFKLKFFYLIHPVRTFRVILRSGGGFKALCIALAGTLGVGNIVGVSSAIMMGGAGAVFWMVLSALIAMSVKYSEAYLSSLHRRRDKGRSYGGAPYYIKDATGKYGALFGGIFAIFCIINSLSTGTLVQINSVSDILPTGKIFFGFVFAFVVFLVIIGGQGRIEAVTSLLIPILTTSYLLISLFIVFSNLSATGVAISTIFKEAFSLKSALCGGVGFGISSAIRYGFTRGLLSNEAGCGTSSLAHASSNLSPFSQGCLGIFEVFWDTVVLCFITALVILISGASSSTPIGLAINSYGEFLGSFGEGFIVCSCVLFALATVCSQYFYGEQSLRFLSTSNGAKAIYSLIFFSVCVFSSIIVSEVMWHICDLVVVCLALYNLVFLVVLSRKIK